jgi:phosphoenolpyruvate-protein kinase (PTS system EI component)
MPHDPRVLGHIAAVVRAAAGAGIPVEVCGEAASDPRTLALLVGLGVGELSVGAARVGMVRAWIRELRRDEAHAIALAALSCASAGSVAALVAPLARRLELLERGDDGGELVEGGRGVVPVGRQA